MDPGPRCTLGILLLDLVLRPSLAAAVVTSPYPYEEQVRKAEQIVIVRVDNVVDQAYSGIVQSVVKGPRPDPVLAVTLLKAGVTRKRGDVALVWRWDIEADFWEPTAEKYDHKHKRWLVDVPMGSDPGFREAIETMVRLEPDQSAEERTTLVVGLLRSKHWQARAIGLDLVRPSKLTQEVVPVLITIANRCERAEDEVVLSVRAVLALRRFRSQAVVSALFPLLECDSPKIASAALATLEELMYRKLDVDLTKPPAQRAASIRAAREWWAENHDKPPPPPPGRLPPPHLREDAPR